MDFAGLKISMLPKPAPGGSVVGNHEQQGCKWAGNDNGRKADCRRSRPRFCRSWKRRNDEGDIANGMGTVDCLTAVMDCGSMNYGKDAEL